jgi:DNA invertase Pin-like site-specific DNA recombinase
MTVGVPKPQRAVAYVRVSMARTGMISPELQMAAINEYCRRLKYQIVEVMEDLDLSGRFWRRRQVDAAISLIEDGDAEVIVVWRWSRVSRDRLDWAVALGRVESAGGRLESATEHFDVTTATGRFARGMLAEFAAYESDRMGDVWREIQDRRARLGLHVNGQTQFGYSKVDGRYVVNRRTGPILREMYLRYNSGESFRSIARWLNQRRYRPTTPRQRVVTWSQQTVSRNMDRGFAAGYIRAKGEFLPGAHKALITEAEWQAYLKRRESRRWHPTTDRSVFLLEGMLICRCGTPMVPEASSKTPNKYRCSPHGEQRRQSTVNQIRVERLVSMWLDLLATDPTWSTKARDESARWADGRWVAARELAAGLTQGGEASAHEVAQAIVVAEAESARIDPVRIAESLRTDWPALTNPERRARLRLLVRSFVADNTTMTTVIEVHTTWGTVTRFWGQARTSDVTTPGAPAVQPTTGELVGVNETDWLTISEAARFAGVCLSTIDMWRRLGFLPDVRSTASGHRLYLPGDLRRVLAMPRRKGGIDRSCVTPE